MKFIKANLIPIICGLVMLVAVVVLFYPLNSMRSSLRKKMTTSLMQAQLAQHLSSTTLHIPGQKRFVGPVTPAIIKVRQKIQTYINSQSKSVAREYVTLNAWGRVEFNEQGQIVKNAHHQMVPLLAGMPWAGMLPHPSQSLTVRRRFRREYRLLFDNDKKNPFCWLTRLNAGMPPTPDQITKLVNARLQHLQDVMPQGFQNSSESNTSESQKIETAIIRRQVFLAASKCKIYADPACFQERNFVLSHHLPTSTQIYEAFVDSWIQNDIVNAILATNQGSANVGTSPVKRLIHITIGTDAPSAMGAQTSATGSSATLVADGGLFLGATAAPQNNFRNVQPGFNPGGSGAPGMPGGFNPGGFNPGEMPGNMNNNVAMTGAILTNHASNAKHQLVLVALSVVVQANKINDFINQIYRQNTGYTVLQMNMTTVDPIRAITEGYVYGKVAAVRCNILMEVLFFTQWNKALMPAEYQARVGLGQTAAVQQ